MIQTGSGPPLVLVPGIQGRWEWMKPAVEALARHFRVITFSLAGDPGSRSPLPEHNGRSRPSGLLFDRLVGQVSHALDAAGADRAVICGVSYGGLVALRFAATRRDRAAALVLASAPGPRWRPDTRVTRYVASPWLSAPGFIFGAPGRLLREIAAARPGRRDRWLTMASYVWAVARHPPSPSRMAARIRAVAGRDLAADARAVAVPTLVITGDADLDRVVPVAGTREYADLIPGARLRSIERTGHIGLVTRPEVFAGLIAEFVRSSGVKHDFAHAERAPLNARGGT